MFNRKETNLFRIDKMIKKLNEKQDIEDILRIL